MGWGCVHCSGWWRWLGRQMAGGCDCSGAVRCAAAARRSAPCWYMARGSHDQRGVRSAPVAHPAVPRVQSRNPSACRAAGVGQGAGGHARRAQPDRVPCERIHSRGGSGQRGGFGSRQHADDDGRRRRRGRRRRARRRRAPRPRCVHGRVRVVVWGRDTGVIREFAVVGTAPMPDILRTVHLTHAADNTGVL